MQRLTKREPPLGQSIDRVGEGKGGGEGQQSGQRSTLSSLSARTPQGTREKGTNQRSKITGWLRWITVSRSGIRCATAACLLNTSLAVCPLRPLPGLSSASSLLLPLPPRHPTAPSHGRFARRSTSPAAARTGGGCRGGSLIDRPALLCSWPTLFLT